MMHVPASVCARERRAVDSARGPSRAPALKLLMFIKMCESSSGWKLQYNFSLQNTQQVPTEFNHSQTPDLCCSFIKYSLAVLMMLPTLNKIKSKETLLKALMYNA